MSKIRVLVVDDAVVIRKIVTDALSVDPDIEICGVAANGKIALQKISQVNPDVITLDIEMPELDGLGTLRELRKDYPRLPVIMFSTLTERGAATTLDALKYGASDYCTKPANVGSVAEAKKEISERLIAKIKSLCKPKEFKPQPIPREKVAVQQRPTTTSKVSSKRRPSIIAIGVSTGGPNALAELIPQIDSHIGVPIVCVQHMPPVFTRMLADRLDSTSNIRVVEAEQGMTLENNVMYIAPGDYHMILKRSGATTVIDLNQDPPENSCRPAVDPLFRSVAELFGARTLGIILTGMGSDGLRGCEYVKDSGGSVIAQDQESSVVWGMPGYVAEAGLADSVLPLDQIGMSIAARFNKK